MTRTQAPWEKAQFTARWATVLTKVRIRMAGHLLKWQLVAFAGRGGQESRGILDVLAVRKNHRQETRQLRRGDMLSMVIIQIKGGRARWPSADDLASLQALRRHHRAEAVVLAEYKLGSLPVLHRLRDRWPAGTAPSPAWKQIEPSEVFGQRHRAHRRELSSSLRGSPRLANSGIAELSVCWGDRGGLWQAACP